MTTRKIFDEMIEGIKAMKRHRKGKIVRPKHETDEHPPKFRPRPSPRKNTR